MSSGHMLQRQQVAFLAVLRQHTLHSKGEGATHLTGFSDEMPKELAS